MTIQSLPMENLGENIHVEILNHSLVIKMMQDFQCFTMNFTFISSAKDGNPPIDINVTKPKTKDAQDPLAYTILEQIKIRELVSIEQ